MSGSEIASPFSILRHLGLGALIALTTMSANSAASAASSRLVRASSASSEALPTLANGDVFRYTTRATTTGLGSVYARTSNDVDTVTYPILYGTSPAYRLTDSVTDTSDPYSSISQIYFRFVPAAGSTDLVELGWDFGETSADGTEADRKAYGLPFYERFAYPERPAAWTNDLPAIVKLEQVFPDGSSIRSFYHALADGSYQGARAVISSGGDGTDTYLANSDASGTLDLTGSALYTFGKPVRAKSSFKIPISIDGSTYDVPDWFPGSSGLDSPEPLSETLDTVAAIGPAPSICGIRARTWAYDVAEHTTTLDPIQGSYTTTTTDYYDSPALGLICSVQNWKQRSYDNLSTGKLLATVETKTVSVLTSESLAGGPRVRVAAAPRNPLLAAPGGIDGLHHLSRWRL